MFAELKDFLQIFRSNFLPGKVKLNSQLINYNIYELFFPVKGKFNFNPLKVNHPKPLNI